MENPADDKAMEGRATNKDGTDAGDKNFHEEGWNFNPESERAQLETLSNNAIALEEQQVKGIAKSDPALGAKAYRQLLNRYPDNERSGEWEAAAEELEKQ